MTIIETSVSIIIIHTCLLLKNVPYPYVYMYKIRKSHHVKRSLRACADSQDSDQPVHSNIIHHEESILLKA